MNILRNDINNWSSTMNNVGINHWIDMTFFDVE